MKIKAFRFAFYWTLAALLLVTCDPFQEEENLARLNTSATDYFILSHSSLSHPSAVMDLRALVSASFTKISIKVSESPTRGTLTFLNDFLLKYTPSDDFTENVECCDGYGKDHFKFEFGSSEGILGTHLVTVHMIRWFDELPCSLIAVEDRAYTTPDTSVPIRILFNDRLCGIKVDDVDVSISLNPKYGQASINTDSIIYTPETGFEGFDEIVYKISAHSNQQISGSDDLLVSYGLVKIHVSQ